MTTKIQALMQKIAEDEKLQEQFEKLETPEEAYELASKLADGFTKEEFLEVVKGFGAYSGEITDEDLAATAGGQDEDDVTVTIVVPNPGTNLPETITRPITLDPMTDIGPISADDTNKDTDAARKAAAI